MNFISLNIKYLFEKENISETEYSALFGLGRGAFGSYISGKAQPKIETLQKLSAKYKIKIDDLINSDLSNYDKKENNKNEEECECCKQKQKEIDNLNFLIERYEKILGLKDLEEGKKSTSESFTGKNIAS